MGGKGGRIGLDGRNSGGREVGGRGEEGPPQRFCNENDDDDDEEETPEERAEDDEDVDVDEENDSRGCRFRSLLVGWWNECKESRKRDFDGWEEAEPPIPNPRSMPFPPGPSELIDTPIPPIPPSKLNPRERDELNNDEISLFEEGEGKEEVEDEDIEGRGGVELVEISFEESEFEE